MYVYYVTTPWNDSLAISLEQHVSVAKQRVVEGVVTSETC